MIEVVAAVIESNGRYLIARRSAEKSLGGKWEFPGGKVEPGETHAQALEREMREEFGVRISAGRVISSQPHAYPSFTIRLTALLSETMDPIAASTDHDRIEWVRATELASYELAEADLPIVALLINGTNGV